MTFSIPDEILREAGVSERDAVIELACRFFDADRLDFNTAARMAGLSRVEFERELLARNLAVTHYAGEDFDSDLRTIVELDERKARSQRGRP